MTARPAPARLATPGGVLNLEPRVPDAPTLELSDADAAACAEFVDALF